MGASGTLLVDTEFLRNAGARLASLAQTFDTANTTARDVELQVGHAELGHEIGEFAVGWDETRAGMVRDVAALGDACQRIGSTFEELDTEFASQLQAPA